MLALGSCMSNREPCRAAIGPFSQAEARLWLRARQSGLGGDHSGTLFGDKAEEVADDHRDQGDAGGLDHGPRIAKGGADRSPRATPVKRQKPAVAA